MIFGLILNYGLAVLCCFHVVRTGQNNYWLWILLAFPGTGPLVYFAIVLVPDWMGGSTARRLGAEAKRTLDPTRAYRDAKAGCEDSPTVGNRMRLAQAAFALQRYEEAEQLFAEAATGIHDEDPALLMGRAQALVEIGRYEDALVVLHKLGETGEKGRTAQAALAMGRAYEGLGRYSEADTAYEWAAPRFAGLEAIARYAAFLAHTGRRDEAQ
ncbi:MAG TPA: hypothetical protein VFN88_00195, partial [Caulobacteraceae bacterium]|nr:hypothetical protein [Caulobacteraceae bacterium]